MNEPTKKLNFDYIKSNQFRTARADGILCGTNGHADIIINVFSERTAIPKRTSHAIEGNQLGEEIPSERIVRDAIVREVEISVSMNVNVAKAVVRMIDSQIKHIEEQMKSMGKEGATS